MKKIKLGRKEYLVTQRDELFKRLVETMAKAEMISMSLKAKAEFLEADMKGANESEVWLLKRELESLACHAIKINHELWKFTQEP